MSEQYAIEVENVKKEFKIYHDRGQTLKEMSLFKKRRAYDKRTVLKNISFKVKKGEAIALIGHNGCGKSTTLKLLTKILYPDEGSITMRGRVSSLLELGAGFHPDMTGRENIYNNASIYGLTKKEIDERVDSIIAFSELGEFIDQPVRSYSSGMYTRLAFAVSVNVDAEILLVDEILAVGDANFQAKCYDYMRGLKEKGVTIVIVTHALGTVRSFCERAIWIHGGEIRAEGESNPVVDEYLAYMNAERAKAEGRPVEQSADSNHYGSGEVAIEACEIINSKGEVTRALDANENYTMRVKYNVVKPVKGFIFAYSIFDGDQRCIFGIESTNKNLHLNGDKVGKGTIEIDCAPLNLLTGKYRLQVSITDLSRSPLDYYREYCKIDVTNPVSETGIIHYDTTWRIV
ncbi:ABC transporter ATP-binding protein [Butyrivibrio sp. WCD2001]|uniref:ABC transporter ATP-binding protein n=1 Tax=Butyrivibrio sp. WCD2001 TaxID=1280681 RepID=UPI00041BD835|nr:ABC transporter ATP-binding protein [Butyrivibrio sp. WCD2001]